MIFPSVYTDPFGALTKNWNSLFEGLANGSGSVRYSWVPAVDIEDHGDAYLITADLPGVRPEDVDISLDGDVLKVSGKRAHEAQKTEGEHDGVRYHRIERMYGSFQRSFQLPADVDPEAVEAHGADGVLTIKISKQATVAPRRITVKSN